MKTMSDYHDLYLKTDALLLADVFEEFGSVCRENYFLDPAWYNTSPSLSFNGLLKVSHQKLELLTDIDMLLMIEKEIRGGISMISNRISRANNLYMHDAYDPSKPTRYIRYLHAKNLHGWAMWQPLPIGLFEVDAATLSGQRFD